MPATDTMDRVTIHLKTDRPVRDRLLGTLRMRGITMQDFFDDLMQTLVERPERIQEITDWMADMPRTPRRAPGRPARV
jgi:hypothetical protein